MTATDASTELTAAPRLRADLHGRVIAPGDPDYDDARAVRAGGFDRRPAAIVRAVDAHDVSHVVSLARETGVPLAVRGGGHGLAGHGVCDGGIVLDLSRMCALDIDPARRTAWAETGLTAGEYTDRVAAHGLATGFGDTGSVGIGGITLGGGIGYLARRHGLTIDDLLAADIVTADGRLRRVDEWTEPDLFWAIRGGGGNFGVATRFQFRLHPVTTVVGGMLVLPATAEVIEALVAEADVAPDDLSIIATVMAAPPMPFIPAERHGTPVVLASMCHAMAATADEAIAPFRSLSTPIADLLRPMPYPQMFPPAEDAAAQPPALAHTMFVDAIDAGAATAIVDHLAEPAASPRAVQVRVLGGAVARVPPDATAYAHRTSRIMVNVGAVYGDQSDWAVQAAWVSGVSAALRRRDAGAYVGFLGDESAARVREAYPEPTWSRLRAVKARYDPANLFRLNQNIPPAPAAA